VSAGGIHRFHTSYQPAGAGQQRVKRRTNVVGIFPDDAALLRLAGMLLLEQNDEWLIARRYLSQESLALVLNEDPTTQEVAQLTSA
jgi:putative transposase